MNTVIIEDYYYRRYESLDFDGDIDAYMVKFLKTYKPAKGRKTSYLYHVYTNHVLAGVYFFDLIDEKSPHNAKLIFTDEHERTWGLFCVPPVSWDL